MHVCEGVWYQTERMVSAMGDTQLGQEWDCTFKEYGQERLHREADI